MEYELDEPVCVPLWPKLAVELNTSKVFVPCYLRFKVESLFAGKPGACELAKAWDAENAHLEPWERMDATRTTGIAYQALRAGNQYHRFARSVDADELKRFAATQTFLRRGQRKKLYYLTIQRTAVLVLDITSKDDLELESVGTAAIERAITSRAVHYTDVQTFQDDHDYMNSLRLMTGHFLEWKCIPQKKNADFSELKASQRGKLVPAHLQLIAGLAYECRRNAECLPVPQLHSVEELEQLFKEPSQDDASQLADALARGADEGM